MNPLQNLAAALSRVLFERRQPRENAIDELMAEVPTAPQWSEPLNFTDPGVARARAELLVREAERRKK